MEKVVVCIIPARCINLFYSDTLSLNNINKRFDMTSKHSQTYNFGLIRGWKA